LIIDDKYIFLTSANFDFRSFWSNFENGILINSPKLCKQMNEIFNNDLSCSTKITEQMSQQFITPTTKIKLLLLSLYKPLL
jgi:phosphatidylserine/phosphatidylglycerophosphate/cardiolipin synthase-like enzyme